jgi:uncharacterized protein (UPF0261 family)
MATIAVVGAMDQRGSLHQFLADCIRQNGHQAIIVDIGIEGSPQLPPHISRENVSGLLDLDWRLLENNRTGARKMMLEAAPRKLRQLCDQRKIQGAICLGFGEANPIGSAALSVLPYGFPKVFITPALSLRAAGENPLEDTLHFPCALKADVLNRLSRPLLARAAGAICGMVETALPKEEDPPVIFASVFGNTATAVQLASEMLEEEGYQVLSFPTTGTGGRTMEALIAEGRAVGVLDFTLKEWADEVVGGVLSAGPCRLESAAKHGVPAVVVPGCLDMVNFHSPQTIPPKFVGRQLHYHNPKVTLLRTNVEECISIGRRIAQKLNASTGPLTVLLPLKGVSTLGAPGFSFHQPKADTALFNSLRTNLRKDIPVLELEATVNDPTFAKAAVTALLSNIAQKSRIPPCSLIKGSQVHLSHPPL